ncbi:MAG: hypothetical protein RL264_1262 [Bacteroidota bacterium]|jgi:DNA-binding response OmpR family regulator
MENKWNVLLAEDDENLGQLLSAYLQNKGFNVVLARSGKIAFDKYYADKAHFDLLLLDVMMPEMDGFTLAKEIRELDKKTPIIFLTAKSLQEDKLNGFDLGADDYLTKPFAMEELLARISAVMKRVAPTVRDVKENVKIGILDYEPELSILHLSDGPKKLTTKENQLLQLLSKNKNEILDRQATLRAVWGDDNYFNGRSMDVYIAKLRKMLKEDPNLEIMNIHGIGFKLIVKE